jgi:hypothetical protein
MALNATDAAMTATYFVNTKLHIPAHVEAVVKEAVNSILGLAPDLSIFKLMESPLDKETGARVILVSNSDPATGMQDLQALLISNKLHRLVFRALCTSHLLTILHFEEQRSGIHPLFRCGHRAESDNGTRHLRVLTMTGNENVGRSITTFLSGDTSSIIFTFATPQQNGMSFVVPRTLSLRDWFKCMSIAFAMGLLHQGCGAASPVRMLDVCLVDMILKEAFSVEALDEADVLAILDKHPL